MLNIMAKPTPDPKKTLGVGTYYERSQQVLSQIRNWVPVRLEHPLMVDERKARMLEQEYATNSDDPTLAMSGAWRLRREIIQQGYDSIIAVDGSHRVRIVQLCRSRLGRSPSGNRGSVTMLHQRPSAEFASLPRSSSSEQVKPAKRV